MGMPASQNHRHARLPDGNGDRAARRRSDSAAGSGHGADRRAAGGSRRRHGDLRRTSGRDRARIFHGAHDEHAAGAHRRYHRRTAARSCWAASPFWWGKRRASPAPSTVSKNLIGYSQLKKAPRGCWAAKPITVPGAQTTGLIVLLRRGKMSTVLSGAPPEICADATEFERKAAIPWNSDDFGWSGHGGVGGNPHHARRLRLSDHFVHHHGRRLSGRGRERKTQPLGRGTRLHRAGIRAQRRHHLRRLRRRRRTRHQLHLRPGTDPDEGGPLHHLRQAPADRVPHRRPRPDVAFAQRARRA